MLLMSKTQEQLLPLPVNRLANTSWGTIYKRRMHYEETPCLKNSLYIENNKYEKGRTKHFLEVVCFYRNNGNVMREVERLG